MKKNILIILLLCVRFLHASNFEIKVAINLNDCIKCSNYLYSLNKLSSKYKIKLVFSSEMMEDSVQIMEEIIGSKLKNYKIEISDSLYQLYSSQSQNYITALINNHKILGTYLRNIDSKIDTLNYLSFEDGDTLNLPFKIDKKDKIAINNNSFYVLNQIKNTFTITDLGTLTTFQINLNRQLLEAVFKKNFNGSTVKLLEAEKLFNEVFKQKQPFKIGSYYSTNKVLYLMVYSQYFIDTIINFKHDTIIFPVIALLEYRKGESVPQIYPLTAKLINEKYSFSQYDLSIVDDYLFVNVLLNNKKDLDLKTKWICKCKLQENIFLDTSDCVNLPKLHNELVLGGDFAQYKLNGDFLINTITNELVNYKTKKTIDLKIPFNKIKIDENDPFKVDQNFSLVDIRIENNRAQIIYYIDNTYNYILYDLKANKIAEKWILFDDLKVLKTAPHFFSNQLIYFIPKNQNAIVIQKIKPL